MNSFPAGLMIEALVAVLLVITIGYCVVLNRKIGLLRSDEHILRTTIAELNKATIRAETAIKGLRSIATDANDSLRSQMNAAESLAIELEQSARHSEQVLSRISAVSRAASEAGARPAAKPAPRQPAPPQAKAAPVAAAQPVRSAPAPGTRPAPVKAGSAHQAQRAAAPVRKVQAA